MAFQNVLPVTVNEFHRAVRGLSRRLPDGRGVGAPVSPWECAVPARARWRGAAVRVCEQGFLSLG